MKYFFAFFLSTSAFAIPYTCTSLEKVGETPVIKFKVTQKVIYTDTHGNEWLHYRVGVTPSEGFRQLVYGQGQVDGNEIALTLLKNDFVLGKIIARSVGGEWSHVGSFQMSGLAQGRELNIQCAASN